VTIEAAGVQLPDMEEMVVGESEGGDGASGSEDSDESAQGIQVGTATLSSLLLFLAGCFLISKLPLTPYFVCFGGGGHKWEL